MIVFSRKHHVVYDAFMIQLGASIFCENRNKQRAVVGVRLAAFLRV